jgi:hypothetical protein
MVSLPDIADINRHTIWKTATAHKGAKAVVKCVGTA